MTYLEKNRGFITQSKLKSFMFCPYKYFLEYVIEVGEEDPSDAMLLGTAIDYYFSYGGEAFHKKYTILEPRAKRTDKETELTASQWESMEPAIRECKRQPLFKMDEEYTAQDEITVEYKNLKVKIKPDRWSLEKKEIRDFKTCVDIEKFHFAIEDFNYCFQVAFYWLIVFVAKEVDCRCFIDAVDKTKNSKSKVYEVSKERIGQEVIKARSALDELSECIETKEYSACEDRDKCLACSAYRHCDKSSIQSAVEFL